MTFDPAPFIALAVVIGLFAAFISERWPPEVSAIGALAILLGTGVLSGGDALAALANPAPIAIACMFILSGALVRVGVLDAASTAIAERAKDRPVLVLAAFAILVLAASAFMNNTPVVVMLIPVAVRLAGALQTRASKLLIPLSYTAILGGSCTLIGTSTNLLVDGVARQSGLEPFGLFEITLVGLSISAVGLIYMTLVGPRLLPNREALVDSLTARKSLKFLTEVAVPEGSPLTGRSPLEVDIFKHDGVTVIDVLRGDESLRREIGSLTLQAGDRIVLRSGVNELLTFRSHRALHMVDRLSEKNAVTVEALISPGCRLVGRSLGRLRLRRRYGVYPLAVHRRDERVGERLDDVVIQIGDTLLLDGDPDDIRRLAEDVDLVDLAKPRERPYRRELAPIVLGALAGVVGLSAIGVAPISTLALIGVAVVLLSGCIDPEEAFGAIDGRLIALILAMLGVGAALHETGAIRMVVDALAPILSAAPPGLILWGLILATSVLTELVTNNAVAVVMTPVAIAVADSAGVDPRPMVVGVMIAASAAFATPIGYQTNTLVYSAGGYRFSDYLRIGAPLNLMVGIVAALVIPMIWAF